jgi:hypothetical protein
MVWSFLLNSPEVCLYQYSLIIHSLGIKNPTMHESKKSDTKISIIELNYEAGINGI